MRLTVASNSRAVVTLYDVYHCRLPCCGDPSGYQRQLPNWSQHHWLDRYHV